jgi:hypothetical protein
MKNTNLSLLDTDQIIKKKFDETHDADRVMLVGGEKLELTIDSDKIANAVKEALSDFKFMSETTPKLDIPTQIQSTEKIVFVPQIEYKTVEVPVYIEKIQYKTIEVPVIVEKIEYRTVEVPVIIKEIEFREVIKERYYPLTIKIATLFQAFCMGALLLLNLLKK